MSVVRFVRWWAVGVIGWLVLSATLDPPDVLAAVAAGLLVAALALVRERLGLVGYRLRWRWLRHLPRLAVQVLRDLGTLASALGRRPAPASRFRAVPLDVGGDDPADVGRRAVLGLATSLGPNTYVIGVDRARGLVLVHQLVPDAHVLPIPSGSYPVPAPAGTSRAPGRP